MDSIIHLRISSEFIIFTIVYSVVSSPTSLIGLDKDLWTLETSSQDRKRYDTILEQVLTQLEPVFMQEQQFCVKFFQVSVHVDAHTMA